MESKADYLITGDKDILELELVKETKMISYVDFEKIMKGRSFINRPGNQSPCIRNYLEQIFVKMKRPPR